MISAPRTGPPRILPSQVAAFSKLIRAKLRERSSGFAKDYLRAVVDEIRVEGIAVMISGFSLHSPNKKLRLSYGAFDDAYSDDALSSGPAILSNWRYR